MEHQLDSALSRRGVVPSTFSDEELASFRARALRDVAVFEKRATELRVDLFARPGSRVVLEMAPEVEPLRVQRFDPIQLFVLGDGEVIQAHYLSLTSEQGSVEFANPGFERNAFVGTIALTLSAGAHPLSEGIRSVTLVGVEELEQVAGANGEVTIRARGLQIELHRAEVRVEGGTIRLRVPGA